MATRFEHSEDDAMSEILRRAIEKDALKGNDSLDRLMTAAAELGISPEAVREAQAEYAVESKRRSLLAQYRAEQMRAFYIHLGVYVAVNLFLALMNVLTWSEDHEVWVLWVTFGWGIGVACHAIPMMLRREADSEAFQRWLAARPGPEGPQAFGP